MRKGMCILVVLCIGFLWPPLASARDILVGVVDDLSGPAAGYGIRHVNGIKLAVEEINNKGGVKGIGKFKLIIEDTGTDPAQAVSATKKVIYRDKVDVLMAACASASTLALLPVFTKAGVPNLNSCSSSPLISSKGSEWIFRTQIVSARSMRGITDFAIDYLKAKKIAVWNDTNEYGRAAAEQGLKRLKERGITPAAHLTHHGKDKDFTPQLMKIKKLGVDTVLAPMYYEEAAIILKQRRDLGIDFQIVSTDVLSTPVFLDLAGELANGTYVSLLFSRDDPDPSAKTFVEAYRKKYGTAPDSLAAMGYDAPYIMWDAITRAGSLDKAKIRDALRTSRWKGICGQTEFSPVGDDLKAFLITQIRDGKYMPVTRVTGR